MILLRNVTKFYQGQAQASVNDITLTINEGETLVLIGSSGCGKTTLLKTINRLVIPDSGEIELDGTLTRTADPVRLRRRIGYVFQGLGLFSHFSILQNVALPLRLLGYSQQQRQQQAKQYLKLVQLDPERYGDCLPSQLSGGQQQRVAVARALIHEPKYLLMDEPFGAVDAITRRQLQDLLAPLRNQLNKTIILVTHDLVEAKRLGDRIGVMDQGRLLQVGTYEQLVTQPETDFVRTLMMTENKISA